MRSISNTNRSNSNGETSGETGDIAAAFTGKDFYQELISKANTVPLSKVFKYYHIQLDAHNTKTICPLKSHSGGRERTPSFKYYPDTNSFHCFGCKAGSRPCDFVMSMDGISRVKAAFKVLDLFGSDVDEDQIIDRQNLSERLEIMMDFSNAVREFIILNTDSKSLNFIEGLCSIYDDMNVKHKLNNEALRRVINQLKERIVLYTPCLML